jgi:hypothetical protein
MAKRMVSLRLSHQAVADLRYCVEVERVRMRKDGYYPPSKGEIVEKALARLAKYYRGLKLPASLAGKGGATEKK